MRTFAIAALAALVASAPTNAASWTFSYVSNLGTLTGSLKGTLQGDNNTIVVSSVGSLAAVDGTPGAPLGFFDSASNFLLGSGLPAIVTLDGAAMDLVACDTALCNEGFIFVTDSSIQGYPFVDSSPSYGIGGVYEAANWSMNAVPEPASWAMLIAGFGLTGAVMRRRRTALAA